MFNFVSVWCCKSCYYPEWSWYLYLLFVSHEHSPPPAAHRSLGKQAWRVLLFLFFFFYVLQHPECFGFVWNSPGLISIFAWWSYLINCFLALLLQQHCVLTDFMTYTHRASSKLLQAPREVKKKKVLHWIPVELNLVVGVMNRLWIQHNWFRRFATGHVSVNIWFYCRK